MHRLMQAILLSTPAYLYILMKPIRTLEGTYGDWLVWILFGSWLAITVSGVIWLVLLWIRFRLLLRRLARQPLVEAYGRLPSAIVSSLERQVTGIVPGTMELSVCVQQLSALSNHAAIIGGPPSRPGKPPPSSFAATVAHIQPDLSRLEVAASAGLRADMKRLGNGDVPVDPYLSATQRPLGIAAALVREALAQFWAERPPRAMVGSLEATGLGVGSRDLDSLAVYTSVVGDDLGLWARLAEDFLATQVTLFVYQLMRHFRLFLTLITCSALLLLLALASYTFQPRHLLMSTIWVVILSSVALALTVLVQMGQDELLSRISKTEPGKVNWLDRAFLVRVGTWAVLPILSLLAVQYPELARGIWEGIGGIAP
jgi:hypothetical protein